MAQALAGDPELCDALLDARGRTGGFLAARFTDSARRCKGGRKPAFA